MGNNVSGLGYNIRERSKIENEGGGALGHHKRYRESVYGNGFGKSNYGNADGGLEERNGLSAGNCGSFVELHRSWAEFERQGLRVGFVFYP